MDGHYVVGVTAIPYPGYGVITNIVSKSGYHIPHHNWRHRALHVSKLYENVISSIGKENEIDVLQTYLICV
jgi:hypothetical protein